MRKKGRKEKIKIKKLLLSLVRTKDGGIIVLSETVTGVRGLEGELEGRIIFLRWVWFDPYER